MSLARWGALRGGRAVCAVAPAGGDTLACSEDATVLAGSPLRLLGWIRHRPTPSAPGDRGSGRSGCGPAGYSSCRRALARRPVPHPAFLRPLGAVWLWRHRLGPQEGSEARRRRRGESRARSSAPLRACRGLPHGCGYRRWCRVATSARATATPHGAEHSCTLAPGVIIGGVCAVLRPQDASTCRTPRQAYQGGGRAGASGIHQAPGPPSRNHSARPPRGAALG